MRFRRERLAESRQGVSDFASVCRAWAHACVGRQAAVPRHTAVLTSMADGLRPRDGKDVEAAVRWALDGAKALDVVGGGTKRGIGRPGQTDLTLDLSGLT